MKHHYFDRLLLQPHLIYQFLHFLIYNKFSNYNNGQLTLRNKRTVTHDGKISKNMRYFKTLTTRKITLIHFNFIFYSYYKYFQKATCEFMSRLLKSDLRENRNFSEYMKLNSVLYIY